MVEERPLVGRTVFHHRLHRSGEADGEREREREREISSMMLLLEERKEMFPAV
jgi:hypothetical protein